MRVKWRVMLAVVVALGLLSGVTLSAAAQVPQARYVAEDGDDYWGENNCLYFEDPCRTIGQAVSVANAGDIVQVSGVYVVAEQLLITKDLTLSGQLGTTLISGPASGATYSVGGATWQPIIFARGEADAPITVTLRNLIVDGYLIDSSDRAVGILFEHARGSVERCIVRGLDTSGDKETFGIAAFNVPGGIRISGNSIDNWSSAGITVQMADEVEVLDNTVRGPGAVLSLWTPSGLRLEGVVRGLVSRNTIRGSWSSYQIGRGYGVAITASSDVLVNYNTITGNDTGISIGPGSDGILVEGNTISGNQSYGVECAGEPGTGANAPQDTAIRLNRFLSDGLRVYAPGEMVDALGNFWEGYDPPTSAIDAVAGTVLFEPWLAANAVIAPLLEPGNALFVFDDSGSTLLEAGYSGSAPVSVVLAAYSSNPGSTTIGADGHFFDVNVYGAPEDAALIVRFFFDEDPGSLYWYDGSSWITVRDGNGSMPEFVADPGPDGYIEVTLGQTSSPTVAQLSGTPFGTTDPATARVVAEAYDVLIPGDRVVVSVEVAAQNLYAAEFKVTWDSTRLSATADDIVLGSWLSPDTLIVKQVSGNEAWVHFTQEAPRAAVTGTGALATISLTAEDVGSAPVAISYLRLTDPDGNEIPLDSAGPEGTTVTISAPGSISGLATLQGRTGHAGVLVAITPGGAGPATSGSDGSFSLGGLRPEAGGYEVRSSYPGYLTAIYRGAAVTVGEDTRLGLIKLLGGDATHDQVINISDLAFIGKGERFGHSGLADQDAWADINGDGIVDILDVALAAVNFGKAAPQPWG